MKVYVGVLYGNDNDTAVVGVYDDPETGRRAVSKAKGKDLKFTYTDALDNWSSVSLEDDEDDWVGSLLAFEVKNATS